MLFSSIAEKLHRTIVFILNDADEAGYFYNDLNTTVEQSHQKDVNAVSYAHNEQSYVPLFFPSSYRRAVKYGQKDTANEILRTEVLSRLAAGQQTKETPINLCLLLHIHRLFLSWWCRKPI